VSILPFLLLPAAVFFAAWLGVGRFRSWSMRRRLLDVPNDRSSHAAPTPRGGGAVIVVLVLAAYAGISFFYPAFFSWGFLAGAALVAIVSWLDDLYTIPASRRLLAQAVAAALVISDLGYWTVVDLPLIAGGVSLGYAGLLVTAVWIVWVINAYNFMDGIDGIAGLQAVVAALGWAAVFALIGGGSGALFSLAIAGASFGFLLHNWHPARIFMGDVGSAFLGFTLAVIPLLAARPAPDAASVLPFFAVSFIWLFLFDMAVTFMRRSFRVKRPWAPHREHFYQKMVISGRSHKFVSKMYGGLASTIVIFVLLAFRFDGIFDWLVVLGLTGSVLVLVFFSRSKQFHNR
jgi:UDP-N-acetylmuramyl pentapeptide phosphotransferase/UDP-N-acetylglucosamine-1-phosphate transferase